MIILSVCTLACGFLVFRWLIPQLRHAEEVGWVVITMGWVFWVSVLGVFTVPLLRRDISLSDHEFAMLLLMFTTTATMLMGFRSLHQIKAPPARPDERAVRHPEPEMLMDEVPVLIWIANPEGELNFTNHQWLDFVGHPLANELGKGWLNSIHPEEAEEIEQRFLDGVRNRTEFTLEYRSLHVDGSYRWILNRGRPLYSLSGIPLGAIGCCIDITAQKELEASYKHTRDQLHQALVGGNIGLWDWNLETNEVYYSPQFLEQLGYPREASWDGYKDWENHLHPEDLKSSLERVDDYLNERVPEYVSIFRLKHVSGNYRWILSQGQVHRNERGKKVRFIGIHVDITERKDSEEALRASETRLRKIINAVPHMVSVRNRQGRFLLMNSAVAEARGMTLEEFMKSTPATAHGGPERLQRIQQRDQEVLQSGEPQFAPEVTFIGPDGTSRLLEVTSIPFTDPVQREECVLEVAVDITRRRQAENKLEFARFSLDRMTDIVLACQPNRQIIEANRAACEALGYERGELLKLTLMEVDTRLTEPQWEVLLQELQKTGTKTITSLFAQKDRKSFDVDIRYSLYDYLGEQRVLAVARDITDQIQAQLRLERYTHQLERSNRDLEQFGYAAAHDLKEPLRAVSGYCQLIQRQFSDQLSEKARHYFDNVVEGAQRMNALLTGLLDFSRIGRDQGGFEMVDSGNTCRQAIQNLHQVILESGARIHCGELPVVRANPSQLLQIFQNLLGNALKYRRDRKPEVAVRARSIPGSWEFAVQDNGIGIDPIFKDQIFQIFKRLHHRDEYPGSGVGLALCQRIIDHHRGKIWVDSAPGEGSTFFFVLPDADLSEP